MHAATVPGRIPGASIHHSHWRLHTIKSFFEWQSRERTDASLGCERVVPDGADHEEGAHHGKAKDLDAQPPNLPESMPCFRQHFAQQ